jgi:hypothetical protein
MKNLLIIWFFCIALWSCDDSQQSSEPVEFDFQLIDNSGKQSTKFSYEENFTFSFSIKNNSEEDLFLSEMYNMDNFFEVFKIGDSDELASYGKSYNAIFCHYVGGYSIKSGETYLVEIPWIPDQDTHSTILCELNYDNAHLPVGNYQTSATPTCTFQKGGEDFHTTTSTTSISFQITP